MAGRSDDQGGDDRQYRVDARGSEGLLIGDQGTQINYFYKGTLTGVVAPAPLVSMSGTIDSPYRGLSAFGERDAALFFGREPAAGLLLERMSESLTGTGLLVVSGVSGSGKSSLIQAGVLPRLRGAGLTDAPGAMSWPCLLFTPGSRPLQELAVSTAKAIGATASAVLRELETDPGGFALTARQAALSAPGGDGAPDAAEQRRVLLIVDQAEQLFTQCDSEQERSAFLTALHAAATPVDDRHGPAALVVLVIRADFEARLTDYAPFGGPVQDRYLLTAMDELQLRMAITQPAASAGSSVDAELVEVLLGEVRTRPGSPGAAPGRAIGAGVLPLLSHALDQAWRNKAGHALTLADYDRTGRIEGAVAISAQRAFDRLTPARQLMARQVFTRLVATTSDGVDTADRATRAELVEGKEPDRVADVEAVLEAFATERLLTLAEDSVEISHEVLLTAWPLLHDVWLATNHAERVTRTQLRATANDWQRLSRDPAYLYRGTLLAAANDMAGRTAADPDQPPQFSVVESDFLRVSNRARRRSRRWRRAVATGLAVLALAASVTAVVAVRNAGAADRNAENAARQHAIALSRQLAADSLNVSSTDAMTARQLAVAAYHVSPTGQASAAMATLLTQEQAGTIFDGGTGIAFSPDSKILATAELDNTVRLWNPVTGQPAGKRLSTGRASHSAVIGVAFSPDGRLLAGADEDGIVPVWQLATGKLMWSLRADTTNAEPGVQSMGVNTVAFSPDGTRLVTGDGNGDARLWNPATGQPVGSPLHAGSDGNGGVDSVAFSRNGTLLATADGDGTVRLWNPATGGAIGNPVPVDPNADVLSVALSPDGATLATDDFDGNVRLWDIRDPLRPSELSEHFHVSGINSSGNLAFSPDGKMLAAGDEFGPGRLWNLTTGQVAGSPLAQETAIGDSQYTAGSNDSSTGQVAIEDVTFSPDGRLLATSESDGTVQLRNPVTGQLVGTPLAVGTGDGARVNAVTFSRNGKLLATAESDGNARLWNPATRQAVGATLSENTTVNVGVNDVAFNPDSTLLATANFDGTVGLWHPGTVKPARAPLLTDSDTGDGGVSAVAFSRDGTLMVTANANGTIQLRNPHTGEAIGDPLSLGFGGDGDAATAVAFSQDSTLLATAHGDGTVRLWNPRTHRLVRTLTLPVAKKSFVSAIAFSPDGTRLATAEGDGTVHLWNPDTGRIVGDPLHTGGNQGGGATAVAFSPDGTLLATANDDGTVRLWNPHTGQAAGALPPSAGPGNGGFGEVGSLAGVADTNGTNQVSEQLTVPSFGQNIGVNGLAFSPDSTLLATADADGTAQLWRVRLFTTPYQNLCSEVGPPSRQEWDTYAPGEPYQQICG